MAQVGGAVRRRMGLNDGAAMPSKLRRRANLLALIILPSLWFVSVAIAQDAAPAKPDAAPHSAQNNRLRGGWYPWDPYQYLDYKHGVPTLTGFDVEIERALARIMRRGNRLATKSLGGAPGGAGRRHSGYRGGGNGGRRHANASPISPSRIGPRPTF